ncbi:MAG: alpha/beta hydrolase [Proteobacteria bacterium]|nr:alpha/beta hydrolase [Pseudomonadota bacterium]
MGAKTQRLFAIINGLFGDSLDRFDTGLTTPMELLLCGGQSLRWGPAGSVLEQPGRGESAGQGVLTPRIAVFVHGLMSTERTWLMPDGETYGSLLTRDLGYTAFFVRYNTGLHISENGEKLDVLLERLLDAYPISVEEMLLVGHSMGGLVVRSATHAASDNNRRWLPLTRRAFYLGSPHLGAPLERLGNLVTWILEIIGNPYTKLIAEIANLRSSGVKDLRYANLRREDWDGVDADALLQNRRHPVPLLPHIRHHLIAGAMARDPRLALIFGDSIVPLRSATGRAKPRDRSPAFPQEHVRVMPMMSHSRLTRDPDVYAQIRAWCEEAVAI